MMGMLRSGVSVFVTFLAVHVEAGYPTGQNPPPCKYMQRIDASYGPTGLEKSCACNAPMAIGYFKDYNQPVCLYKCLWWQRPVWNDKQYCACNADQGIFNGKCVTPPPPNPDCQQNPIGAGCPSCANQGVAEFFDGSGNREVLCKCNGDIAEVSSYGTNFKFCNMPLCTDGQVVSSSWATLSCKCERPDRSWQVSTSYKCVRVPTCAENAPVYAAGSQTPLCYCGDDDAAGIYRLTYANGNCVTIHKCTNGQLNYSGTDIGSDMLCLCDQLSDYPTQTTTDSTAGTVCVDMAACAGDGSGYPRCACNPTTQDFWYDGSTYGCFDKSKIHV